MTSFEFSNEYLKLMKWNMKLLIVLKMIFWARLLGILIVYAFFFLSAPSSPPLAELLPSFLSPPQSLF
jgi:ABC-type phosphate/phosphonate transport system permease subunit